MPESQATASKARPKRTAGARKTAARKATTGKAVRKKKGLVHAVRKRVGKNKASGGFGGYRKRTMTAREFAGSLYSLAPQAQMLYQIWGKQELDPKGFDRAKWVAISYVRALVSANFGRVSPDLREEMTQHYSAHEIKEIELVAQLMDIANRGAHGRPVAGA